MARQALRVLIFELRVVRPEALCAFPGRGFLPNLAFELCQLR
jgi:hypothetical protein